MDNFQIKISRVYTDMNGTVIDKTIVPIQMQRKVPFYLFNLFDKNGAYLIGRSIKPVQNGMYFLYSYVNDGSYNFLDFQFGNTIKQYLNAGDVICVLGDNPVLPTILCHVILHSDYVSYASFLSNMQGKKYEISRIQYATDNELNWQESFNTPNVNDFGLYSDDQIQPIVYRNPYNYLQGILDMNIKMNVSDKQGLYSYMLFATDSIEMTFYIDNIISLTSKTDKNGNTSSQAVLFQVR